MKRDPTLHLLPGRIGELVKSLINYVLGELLSPDGLVINALGLLGRSRSTIPSCVVLMAVGNLGCYPKMPVDDSGFVEEDSDDTGDRTPPEMECDTWYADSDFDGYGSDVSVESCSDLGDGFVLISGDCDDGDDQIHPDATEVCDGQDNDCDGLTDDEDDNLVDESASTWYIDSDGDGYGDPDSEQLHCSAPDNGVENGEDCDDSNAASYPGAEEICDGEDNDCNEETDEGLDTWYSFHDNDGDGEGDPLDNTKECETPVGYVLNPFDCDDTEPGANTSTPSDAFIDSDGDGEDNCWEPSVYSFDPSWGEGTADDWLVDNGDETYTPIDELNLCGYTDSPFGTADGNTDGLGTWTVDEYGVITEESNDACHGIGIEIGSMEAITVDVEYTMNDSGSSAGMWVAIEVTDGYLVAGLRYPYISTPPLGMWYFEGSTGIAYELNEDNQADFAAPSGAFSVTILDSVVEATIAGASVIVDDSGEFINYGLSMETGSVYIGSWDNDVTLELDAITVTNPLGWSYEESSGTYTH